MKNQLGHNPEEDLVARRYYRWDLENDVANPMVVGSKPKVKSLLEFD